MACSSTNSCQTLSASDFINRYVEFARYASYQLKWPVSLILGQWSIESDWGRLNICTPCNNPGNSGLKSGNCPHAQYSNLCQGVIQGFVNFSKTNYDHSGSGKTYAKLVADASSSESFTIPSSNNYGCLPGAGTTIYGNVKAACAALGSSGWAESDYCYCSSGTGKYCCSGSNWTGQTLYERIWNYFYDYSYIHVDPYYPSCC